jgi:carboxyl-terminal processing protease
MHTCSMGSRNASNNLFRDRLPSARHALACLTVLLVCGPLLADSILREDKPASPPLERIEAERYAYRLIEIIERIRKKYVRPVPRAELANAALEALYRAAQVPIPATLHARVLQAADNHEKLYRLLVGIREDLGNPESVRGVQALLVGIQGLTQALDPFSVVATGTELERTDSQLVQHRGIGLELQVNATSGPLVIKAVAPGGPAQKAGLRPGDRITHIDGQVISNSLVSPAELPPNKAVRLRLYRPSTHASWNVALRPEIFRPETVLGVMRGPNNSWDYFLDHDRRIAQVRLGSLEHGTAEELARVLSELTEAGMRGLILDLRWSPGGYLPEARYIADLFIAGYFLPHFVLPAPGNLFAVANLVLNEYPKNAAVIYRERGIDDHHPPMDPGFIQFPMVVLVNDKTSGGAELIAAVLQDNLRAKIVGQRTRGKASVQEILSFQQDLDVSGALPPGTLKLTTGILIRPSGRNLHRFANSKPADDWGVRPDPGLDFRVSPDLERQLHAWWQLQDLRPGTSNECLPLDDPVSDPQRQAALQVLMDELIMNPRR